MVGYECNVVVCDARRVDKDTDISSTVVFAFLLADGRTKRVVHEPLSASKARTCSDDVPGIVCKSTL